MVKKIIITALLAFLLSSCAFFGSSVFPAAESMDISWFRNRGNIENFFILDNGENEPLLFLMNLENSYWNALIFDTSLNIRSFLTNNPNIGNDPFYNAATYADIDSVGFVNFQGDFIIGTTRLTEFGTIPEDGTGSIFIPDYGNNAAIIPYIKDSTNYYLKFDFNGDLKLLNENWDLLYSEPISFSPDTFAIPQSDNTLIDLKLGNRATKELYSLTKDELYNHATGLQLINSITPVSNLSDDGFTDWITRCSRGLFIATDYGDLVLLDESGNEIERIRTKRGGGNPVTVDYDCEYYYRIIEDGETYIVKERVPF